MVERNLSISLTSLNQHLHLSEPPDLSNIAGSCEAICLLLGYVPETPGKEKA